MIIWLQAYNGDLIGQANVGYTASRVMWQGRMFEVGPLGSFRYGTGGPPTTYRETSPPVELHEVGPVDLSLDVPYQTLP